MIDVSLTAVSKVYPTGVLAVADVSLHVLAGECVAVVGPSGGGKTSLLRLIAGLEDPTTGRICLAGRDVAQIRPQDRDVAMVFQTPALYPQLTVRDNLAFSLRIRRTPGRDVDQRVGEIACPLGLAELLDRRPNQLSGGQRQRVALGRALVRRPAVLLLDEPLSHLDTPLRAAIRDEITRTRKQFGMTALWVTHDPVEATEAADRVIEMRDGRVVAVPVIGESET